MADTTPQAKTTRPPVAIETLAAVHHPTRRRIIDLLTLEGAATVGAIAAALGEQVGSISHHLKTLERVGIVTPAPELARDRRESWWRAVPAQMSWSVSDYRDSPADVLVASAAEVENIQHHLSKVLRWFADREQFDEAWVDAAFSTEVWTEATAAELVDLTTRIQTVTTAWSAGCKQAAAAETDSEERVPVYFFAHANPARP